MLSSCLAGCANGSGTDTDTNTAQNSASESVSDQELPDIPSGVTYNGYEFTTLVSGTLKYSDFDFEQNDGSYETVNAAIEKRNAQIEQKYDIKFNNVTEFGT
ncbi:MAG: hypothetical protein UHG68_00560, partial [Clostridia bacterium]|nr:hypothetical protein [Clostridia bacterium]